MRNSVSIASPPEAPTACPSQPRVVGHEQSPVGCRAPRVPLPKVKGSWSHYQPEHWGYAGKILEINGHRVLALQQSPAPFLRWQSLG